MNHRARRPSAAFCAIGSSGTAIYPQPLDDLPHPALIAQTRGAAMRFTPIFLAAAICIVASNCFAGECAKIGNDLDRLACYDRESGRAPEVTAESKGIWRAFESKSKITDQRSVAVQASSEEIAQCGYTKDTVELILSCYENKTRIYTKTACFVASNTGSYGMIDFRTDADKSRTFSTDASTDNKALGLWNGGQSIPVIKSMFGKNRLVIRFTPYNESSIISEFNITGLEEAIKPLREACGW